MRNTLASGDRVVFDACHHGKHVMERKMTTSIGSILGSILCGALLASTSQAQSDRTFVSGVGDDANPCSRTQPCRSFNHAISESNPGGEVVALDSGEFDPVTITKSISLVAAPGAYAAITVRSGAGILVSGAETDVIILRGLSVVSRPNSTDHSSANGIVFEGGGKLHVENCIVNGFNQNAETFERGAGLAVFGNGSLEVKDSIMRGNVFGILLKPLDRTALAAIDQVRLEGNLLYGLLALNGARVAARRSLASANYMGFVADAQSPGTVRMNLEECTASNNAQTGIASLAPTSNSSLAEVTVERCQVSGNRVGITTAGRARARVSNSNVTDNDVGLAAQFSLLGFLVSRENNTIEANGLDTMGFITTYSAK